MVFPVVMYACESWTIKKLSAKKLMLLNHGVGGDSWVPWTARRSNQSILKEINPGCSLEGLNLKLSILWPPYAKGWLIGKDPDAGKDWRQEEKGTRGWGGWMASLTRCLSKLEELVVDREAWRATVHGGCRVGHNWATELILETTELYLLRGRILWYVDYISLRIFLEKYMYLAILLILKGC